MTALSRLAMPWPRRLAATLAAVVAAVAWWRMGSSRALLLPMGCLAATTLVVHSRDLAAQIFVRSVLWSSLLLGTATAVFDHSPAGGVIAVAAAAALVAVGNHGMGDDRAGRFAPVAFRRTLIASLVFALAEWQFLLFYAGVLLERRAEAQPVLLLLAASGAMLAAANGLLRLRAWGLFLHVGTAAAVVLLARADLLAFSPLLTKVWTGVSAVQLLLPIPMIVAVLRGARRL